MTARQLIERVQHLPPAPHSALRLVSLLGRPGVGNDEVIQVLKCDNVLTAKLLSACNSSWLGLEEPVGSIDEAVLMLGHGQILQMVLNIAFGTTMAIALPLYASEAKTLWRHSLLTASSAEAILSRGLGFEADPALGFTAGLLHDFGKLVLNEVLSVEIQFEIRELLKVNPDLRTQAEKAVTGTDHAEVGACLLESWKLPANIVEAVANHHHPSFKPAQVSAVIGLANSLAHHAESDLASDAPFGSPGNDLAGRLGISPENISSLIETVRDSFDRLEHFLKAA